MIGTLTEEISTAASREPKLRYHDESDPDRYKILEQFLPSGLHCIETNTLFGSKVTFRSGELSIDALWDEMQPLVLENKRFDSQKQSQTLVLSRFFGP